MKWLLTVKRFASWSVGFVLVSGILVTQGLSLLLGLFGLAYRMWLTDVLFLALLIGLFCFSVAIMVDSCSSRIRGCWKFLICLGGIGICLLLSIFIWFVFLFTISGRADYEEGMEKVYREVKEEQQYLYTETLYYRVYDVFLRGSKPVKVEKFYP